MDHFGPHIFWAKTEDQTVAQTGLGWKSMGRHSGTDEVRTVDRRHRRRPPSEVHRFDLRARESLTGKRLQLIVWLADSYTATNRPAEAGARVPGATTATNLGIRLAAATAALGAPPRPADSRPNNALIQP